jgi:4'-phosphopantetheinyl transferase
VENWTFGGDDEVQIWYTSLDVPDPRLQRYAHLLSQDERHRATAFRFDSDRVRWIAARLYLRALLGNYLHCPPQDVDIRYGEYGKPYVDGRLRHFNVSHTKMFAVYAVTRSRAVGIDVEHINPTMEYMGIVREFFSPAEVATFERLPNGERLPGFFRTWTRKEAYLKAIGQGISQGLDHAEPDEAWTIETFPLSPDHMVSFAANIRPCRYNMLPLPPFESLL